MPPLSPRLADGRMYIVVSFFLVLVFVNALFTCQRTPNLPARVTSFGFPLQMQHWMIAFAGVFVNTEDALTPWVAVTCLDVGNVAC